MSSFDDLKTRLRGPLMLPGDAGYDDARSVWNGMIDRRPAAIARCLGTSDVIACVNAARDAKIPLSIKGGGHNIAGLAVANDALMIDMALMRGVWVDTRARVAHAQAGCLLGDVDRETQLHGLATCLGFVSNTGIAGLTLGGGFGYLTRRFGWSSDNVASMDVVTADGRLLKASEWDHADLFWGLRGGGGNFGVVTGFEYKLHDVGPEIVAGPVAWPAAEAPGVLKLYQEMSAKAPLELTLVCVMRLAPPAPWLAKEIHGKPIIMVLACHTGSIAQAEKDVARLKAHGKPVGDVLQKRPYVSIQNLLDATQPKGRRYYWKSEYLPGVSNEFCDAFVGHAGRISSPHSAIVMFQLDGALNRLPPDHSPVGNRDAKYLFNVTAAWDKPDGDAEQIEWARTSWRDLKRFSTGGTYVNFLTEEDGGDRIQAAYGANFARLAAVKQAWDPGNLFQANKNIAPTGR